jgi:hypothetical protein
VFQFFDFSLLAKHEEKKDSFWHPPRFRIGIDLILILVRHDQHEIDEEQGDHLHLYGKVSKTEKKRNMEVAPEIFVSVVRAISGKRFPKDFPFNFNQRKMRNEENQEREIESIE